MSARRPRVDFMLSREVLEAAAAYGRMSDAAASKAMHGAARRLIREQQYRAVMQQKARLPNETASGPGAALEPNETRREQKEEVKMDTREFFGTFLKPEDVTTPVVLTIADVAKGKYGLDLTFGDGSKLGLNNTNGRKLQRAWGVESATWLDKQVELSAGVTPYNGEDQPTVVLKPVSPAMSATEIALAKPATHEIDDDIPF
jgi:hypothetical protein